MFLPSLHKVTRLDLTWFYHATNKTCTERILWYFLSRIFRKVNSSPSTAHDFLLMFSEKSFLFRRRCDHDVILQTKTQNLSALVHNSKKHKGLRLNSILATQVKCHGGLKVFDRDLQQWIPRNIYYS